MEPHAEEEIISSEESCSEEDDIDERALDEKFIEVNQNHTEKDQ